MPQEWTANVSVPLNTYAESLSVLASHKGGPETTLPVSNPTTSFWLVPGANPLAAEGSTGPLTTDADVCIIGSGITGLSAAYHLAKTLGDTAAATPLKVVIVEARDFCSGATGRNGGHLTPYPYTYFRNLVTKYGAHEAKRGLEHENYTADQILRIIREERLAEKVDLVHGGHCTLFLTSREYEYSRADFEAARAAGVNLENVEWLDKEQVKETYGAEFPAAKFGGHNLWPLKFVTQLYYLAKRQSSVDLHLHTRTPVTAIKPINDSSRCWELVTQRGSITCTRVIHATNAYAGFLLPHLQGPAGIVPTRGQIIALRANAPVERIGMPSWDANEGQEYWFPRPPTGAAEENALIILGGARAVGSLFGLYESDDSIIDPKVGQALRGFLDGIFGDRYEKGREPEMEWTGIMGYTRQGDPFVGPVIDPADPANDKYKGQFVSAGYSGHGMPRAFSCGKAVALMVAAEIQGKDFEQPVWLPDRYLTWNRYGRKTASSSCSVV